MIDTTELRRLRDADGSTEWAYLNFVQFACDNAHAIADELDALRSASDGYAAAFADQHAEIESLRKRVAEAELLLACVFCDGKLLDTDLAAINEHLTKYGNGTT